ncbi:ABC transporter ATP-binding protein [Devosia sp. 63-57]|uniref:ABC transporter ATP-binding protein n=1 Tax=Devosia sp. 63-57 TaxID=1895751 RepID=UPI00086BDE7A|nr:ABC transporter ATP-binding protein [Devosia sp. 63-57]ODT47924.1 MAG: ABC transporter [Pelagibacterium sp. SCN 63-126]ODU87892.1 MAG: ABC transporter [Pelagibacterium sp. SCN 63-17]OJX43605.1 MAG: ABC transporter ATP-binding protein [Devosia sp. 63-57]
MSRVTFKAINKLFPGRNGRPDAHAVRDLDLVIEDGALVTLLGPSGCGKTTTLRMLAGFETPSSGSISIDDRDITTTPVNKRDIGMVFQSYALFPHMSVRENVAFGLKVLKLSSSAINRRVEDILKMMALSQLADRQPSQLSGGQQQRVALARTVVAEPRVLLFDEPLSNLDAQLRERMRDELRQLQQRLGITSLYVTHDQSEAMAISDRVVVMRDGVVEQNGAPQDIYARPATAFVAEFMGKANIVRVKVESVSDTSVRAKLGGASVDLPRHVLAIKPGEVIDYVIRPEQMLISETGDIAAVVERAVYQGGFVEYHVTIDGAACTLVDHLYHRHRLHRAGETIRVDIGTAVPWPLAASIAGVSA